MKVKRSKIVPLIFIAPLLVVASGYPEASILRIACVTPEKYKNGQQKNRIDIYRYMKICLDGIPAFVLDLLVVKRKDEESTCIFCITEKFHARRIRETSGGAGR